MGFSSLRQFLWFPMAAILDSCKLGVFYQVGLGKLLICLRVALEKMIGYGMKNKICCSQYDSTIKYHSHLVYDFFVFTLLPKILVIRHFTINNNIFFL